MDHTEAWTIDDDSESHPSVPSSSFDDTSQRAPLAHRSRLRPAGAALTFVPFAEWEPERSYDDEPTIRSNNEWKLFAKNRGHAGESELDVVISPRKFWKHVLQPKVAGASAGKPWKEDATKLVLSVTDRKPGNITKRFPKLDIDWPIVTRQLREWSKFLDEGKKITITATFYYVNVDVGKSGRAGATATQEADLEARTIGLGRGACIRQAYALMRCPGRPCTKGDHCWQHDGKHYRLLPHHVRMLADHLQAGRPLNGHDDVPDEFRRLVQEDERERDEREQRDREDHRRNRCKGRTCRERMRSEHSTWQQSQTCSQLTSKGCISSTPSTGSCLVFHGAMFVTCSHA
ncbi:uncharacterized protein BDZ83DRAFT_409201 [Colletotrichum acutatum]|uniref:Uncharacterized protein n=1 Tax=Glomerella acutata TaxID=27357 RepID=A0AAD8UKA8_GLOAC|nr:uncharacterized protein BDZ83DRAFT_409201 [Colletotrichum acutatum]KAK1722921.1 hypothetical protein BDZ83DRAFT_409201 [Colletotrichum acutatum]